MDINCHHRNLRDPEIKPVPMQKPRIKTPHTARFLFGKESFLVPGRKSRGCAEAYIGTPHKKPRRLTPSGRKRILSGLKLAILNAIGY
jgi:hypothetical protein